MNMPTMDSLDTSFIHPFIHTLFNQALCGSYTALQFVLGLS